MPLDAHIKPIVDVVNAGASEPAAEQTLGERREAYHKLLAALPPGPDVFSVSELLVEGPASPITIRIYRPAEPRGVVVFFHGGGFVIGDLDTHDEPCREIVNQSGATVVSVDYRLAPEAPFPAGINDSFAALRWVSANRADLATSDAKIAVCGDSAGANIATVMCLMARDVEGLDIAAQLLVYPGVDARMTEFDSLDRNGVGYVLTRETMTWFMGNYLASEHDALDWRASPLLADDLSGLPPALVITAEYDPLHDEGLAYAAALRAAGNDVVHSDYDGMVHIFFQLGPVVPAAAAAVAEVAAAAKSALAS